MANLQLHQNLVIQLLVSQGLLAHFPVTGALAVRGHRLGYRLG